MELGCRYWVPVIFKTDTLEYTSIERVYSIYSGQNRGAAGLAAFIQVMNMVSFLKWLVKQKERDDPIGDLSRDFIEDKRTMFPDMPRLSGYPSLRRRMIHLGCCDNAMLALERAWNEYARLVGKEHIK